MVVVWVVFFQPTYFLICHKNKKQDILHLLYNFLYERMFNTIFAKNFIKNVFLGKKLMSILVNLRKVGLDGDKTETINLTKNANILLFIGRSRFADIFRLGG